MARGQEHREGTRLAGGKRNGPMVRPTVLTGTHPPMKARDEEIFGPAVRWTRTSIFPMRLPR
ncbi:MAG: aldehyde dehydrogenase family protein [Acidobacteriaceae bacterium]